MKIDYLAVRDEAVADTECYPNFWCIGFMQTMTRKKVVLRLDDETPLDRERLARLLFHHRVYTFNGLHYDIPMITYAMSGASCAQLKIANDLIIPGGGKKGLQPWEFYDHFNLKELDIVDHIDLFNVAPSAATKTSLKKYAGMMHSKRMRELPYAINRMLTRGEKDAVVSYMGNDLDVTDDLRAEMVPQIALRSQISAEYELKRLKAVSREVDFRSKSDAQCGEAAIKLLAEAQLGRRVFKPDIERGHFFYEPPDYIEFKTPQLQQMLAQLRKAPFLVKADGYVELPPMFVKKKGASEEITDDDGDALFDDIYEGGSSIYIGDLVLKMGNGGLHSQEKSVSYYEDDEFDLCDNDVTSYYPWLMIRSGREPSNMQGVFIKIFLGLVQERVRWKEKAAACKHAGDKAGEELAKSRAESLKIFINGLFGKTGSPWSVVYAPKMMIQTTVTGQLSMLMAIEEFELRGWQVVSANTDGFVSRIPKIDRGLYRSVMFDWEVRTGLNTEETFYKSYHARDVNNYVAFAKDQDKAGNFTGKVKAKRKGSYAPSGRGIPAAMGLKKSPNAQICAEAVIAFLKDGTPIAETIKKSEDIRLFVNVRNVKGGALKDDEIVGKVVRFYYATDWAGPLTYILTGNRVPRSEGAYPLPDLPDEFPSNIDYAWYIREAYAIMNDMGMEVEDPSLWGRKGQVFGHLDKQTTIHLVNTSTGIALCGHARKDRRDLWNEYKEMPSGHRLCAKCRKADAL